MNPEQHAEFYQEVLTDIAMCEKQLDELRAIAQYHAAKAGISGDSKPPKPSRKAVRFAKIHQIKAVETILREAGEPLRTAEIVSRMKAGGFPGKDPARVKMSIFTSMTRKIDIFKKTGPGMWSLVSLSEPDTE